MKARFHDTMVNVAAHPVGWPLARLARRVGGVIHLPGFGFVVSDAEFAHDVLVRDDDFTKNGPRSLSATITELIGPFALANMDGDEHRRLRGTLSDVMSRANARRLLAACDAPIAHLRADLTAGRTVDLVRWMRVVSGRLTFDMLGVAPPAGREDEASLDLVALGQRIASGFDFRFPSPRRLETTRRYCDQLAAYARHGYESPAAPPTSFVRRLRDLGLSFEEAKGVISLIFLAGTLTTAAALPRIVALLADAGRFAWLRERPELLPATISEGLRYTSPVPATVRIARRDVDLRGRRIPKDSRLVILTCNLSRDRRLFRSPDRFEPSRVHDPRARNLWFGAGAQFCLGFPVAQLQLQLVMEALLAEPGDLRIIRRRAARGVLVPAYSRLDVRLEPAAT
jgi:cytochrome P450